MGITGARAMCRAALVIGAAASFGARAGAQRTVADIASVRVRWDRVIAESRTTPSLQVVVNPPLRRGSSIHDAVFASLRDLQASYVRYVPWLPYPKLAVAELEPPANGRTSWDFSLIDPMTIDFLDATRGHPVIMNFSTMPAWMWKTPKPVSYPADPDQVDWSYTQGAEPRDTTMREIAGYYARLLSWYTRGGFTDELGKRHESGHHYDIAYWEVLNEPDYEHDFSPQRYTKLYDAVVTAMHRVSPRTKFGGLALASPTYRPDFFTYFLNPAHHRAGVPLDFITYHFYATPPDTGVAGWPALFFAQGDRFLGYVSWIEAIRKELSPHTRTLIDEVGSIARGRDSAQGLPDFYWNLSGALYAYLYGQLARMGIDVVNESQLVGYPTQYPSVSLLDWNSGRGNARYWVLKLIRDRFGPGDRIVDASVHGGDADGGLSPYAYAVVGRDGRRRILLVNRRNAPAAVTVQGAAGAAGGDVAFVDETTADGPPRVRHLDGDIVALQPLAVAVLELP